VNGWSRFLCHAVGDSPDNEAKHSEKGRGDLQSEQDLVVVSGLQLQLCSPDKTVKLVCNEANT
jgi:hypothetical protein